MEKKLKLLKEEYKNLKEYLDNIAINKYGMDEDGGFPSSLRFKSYVDKNRSDLEKLKLLREQIQQLEWELMSPKERAKEEEVLRLMKLKREGKL